MKQLEEAIQPRSVKDSLKDLINLSSLMLDLAYASIMYDDEEIAKQVLDLERSVNDLKKAIIIHMSLAVRSLASAEKAISVFKIADVATMVAYEAIEIAKIVLEKMKIHQKIKEGFMRTDESVSVIQITRESRLEGLTIENALIASGVGFDVIGVKRSSRWVINPSNEFELKSGDILVVRGTTDALTCLKKICGRNIVVYIPGNK
ncbi:MAG: TrkA C-terminal domain-containing protein [Candidatus Bathyarchaeia archaeon]